MGKLLNTKVIAAFIALLVAIGATYGFVIEPPKTEVAPAEAVSKAE